MIARRSEIWYANLDPTQGSEQAGVRPVLVFQADKLNRAMTTTVVIPLTTNLRRAALPSCLQIAKGEGDLTLESVALCHQMRVVDETRLQSPSAKGANSRWPKSRFAWGGRWGFARFETRVR